jgi:NADH-quinone oxidoreductase subunit M
MALLPMLILIPAIASFLLIAMRAFSIRSLKGFAFIMSLSSLVLLLSAYNGVFDSEIIYPWVSPLAINFHLKIDELSLVFLYLTAIIFPIAILAVKDNSSSIFGFILFLQALLLIFFTAKDLVVFTIFWEATLLPLYFIITLYGRESSKKAALQFIVYMIAGSCLLVAAVLSLYFSAGQSFNLDVLQKISDNLPHADVLFGIFLLAFAVKTPFFPFHGWLPNTYTESSTAGTILLSAVLSKTGIYGIIRIGMGLFPTQINAWSPYLLPLAIFAVLYGGFAAWMQKDYKRLIAYSSFSHVNFIVAGLFISSELSHTGALLQVINHAITITGLFLVASFLEDRIFSRTLKNYRGLLKYLPNLCWLTLIFVLASVAIPGTNNFIGEFLIFLGLFKQNPWYAAILGFTIILSVIYMLRYMELNFFGKDEGSDTLLQDIGIKEILIVLPLIILIFLIGIYPQSVLHHLETIR